MNKQERKKSFLFVTNTEYGSGRLTGGHKRFLELVDGISRENDVILVSRRIPGLRKNVKVFGIVREKKRFLPSHIDKIIKISTILRKERKNIPYDYAVSFGPEDVICYKISGYDNIVTLFREDYVGYREVIGTSALKMLYYRFLEKYAVKKSKKIIVQCEDDKDALIKRYNTKVKNVESKIHVQINNVNASWILRDKGREKRKKNDDTVRVVFIGNFADTRKGQQVLLPAIQKLVNEGYDVKLNVVGDGKQLEMYKKEYKECKNIVFLGRVNNIGELLAESDFEIVPSLMDSCPNTVLEGINAGIAVYGTNVGGIKDMLHDKEYLFEPDVDSIYIFLKKIIDAKKYVKDAIDQQAIKEKMTFDWASKIEKIIIGK